MVCVCVPVAPFPWQGERISSDRPFFRTLDIFHNTPPTNMKSMKEKNKKQVAERGGPLLFGLDCESRRPLSLQNGTRSFILGGWCAPDKLMSRQTQTPPKLSNSSSGIWHGIRLGGLSESKKMVPFRDDSSHILSGYCRSG
jgi:hypothetical protein